MPRIRTFGSYTAVINDDHKTISIRHRRPELDQLFIPGSAEKDRAISEMDLNREIDQGYEILDELAE